MLLLFINKAYRLKLEVVLRRRAGSPNHHEKRQVHSRGNPAMFQIIFLLSGDLVILLHYISVIALSTVLHICTYA